MTKIAVISGSLKASSANSALVRAAARVAPEDIELAEFDQLAQVPNLDPALDGDDETAPAAVVALRRLLRSSDALLIASPEYGHSMPGTLKNALDWLVGSGELAGMPIALVSASTTQGGGIRAQMALIQTLLAQAAHIVVTQTVPSVKSKLDANGELDHPATARRLGETLAALREGAAELPERVLRH